MKKIILIASMLVGVAQAQMTLNQPIAEAGQFSVDNKQYKLVSGKHVPYTSASDFLTTIPNTRRHVGQIAYVGTQVYHFVNNIADSSFVLFADTTDFTRVGDSLILTSPVRKAVYAPVGGGVTAGQVSDSLSNVTWERTLQNQGSSAFTTDNTVDFGGKNLILNNLALSGIIGERLNFISGVGNIDLGGVGAENSYMSNGTDDINQLLDLGGDVNTATIYSDSLTYRNSIKVHPNYVEFTSTHGAIDSQVVIKADIDSSNANPNNIAWFDEHGILHRGALTGGSGVVTDPITYGAQLDGGIIRTSGSGTDIDPIKTEMFRGPSIITSSSSGSGEFGTFVQFNPSSTISTYSLTLPTTSTNEVQLFFGGTMTTGDVVTTLTLITSGSDTFMGSNVFANITAGTYIEMKSVDTKWFITNITVH